MCLLPDSKHQLVSKEVDMCRCDREPQEAVLIIFGYHQAMDVVAYAENFHAGGIHSVAFVVIFIWCGLFVTSQFDVIFMFPNQHIGEVY